MRRAASTGVVSTEKSWEPQPEVRNPARDLNSKPEVPGALNAMCRWKGTPPKRPKLKTQHVCAAGGASGIRGCGSPSQRAEDRKLLVVSSNQKTLGCRVWGPDEVISTLPLSGGEAFPRFCGEATLAALASQRCSLLFAARAPEGGGSRLVFLRLLVTMTLMMLLPPAV